MPNSINIANAAKIAADLEGISAMWVIDYKGLTVKESEELRRSLRAVGAKMGVYKNTLMRLGLKEAGQPAIDEILNGPSAFVFAKEDPAAAAKAVKDFADKSKKIVIKGGVMDGLAYNAEQVEKIASLPSREQVLGQIAAAITGVISGLAVAINGIAEPAADEQEAA